MECILGHMGHRVKTARNALEALELLRNDVYHLVLTDLSMPPGPEGTEIVKFLKRGMRPEKVILMSGYCEVGEIAKGLKADGSLEKPFSSGSLSSCIGKAFAS
jgi:DNA-binding NtrC family response regulator